MIALGILIFLGVVFLLLKSTPSAPLSQPDIPRGSFPPATQDKPSSGVNLSEQLTATEKSYPSAPPQSFPGFNPQVRGGLVVTTTPSEARVLVDAAESEEGEAPLETAPSSPPPTKISPFTFLDIPEGSHVLSVFKKGYLEEKIQFIIKPDEITRINIHLTPLTEAYR